MIKQKSRRVRLRCKTMVDPRNATITSGLAFAMPQLQPMRPDLSANGVLKDAIDRMVSCLGADESSNLVRTFIVDFGAKTDPQRPTPIPFGTACSGSELYLSTLKYVEIQLRRKGVYVTFVHMWAIEKMPSKRAWILANWQPRRMFGDIIEVAANDETLDYVSGGNKALEPIVIMIGGTSCKDASRLNVHHRHRMSVMQSGSETTGSTFAAFMAIAKKMKPKRIYLENVASLKDKPVKLETESERQLSNFESVHMIVNEHGRTFIHEEFEPLHVGIPVRRRRIYMEGREANDDEPISVVRERRLQASLTRTMSSIFRASGPVSLDDLLLPEYDEMAEDWLVVNKKTKADIDGSGQPEDPDWQWPVEWHSQHAALWKEIPFAVDKALHRAAFEDNCFFHAMCPREQDVLLMQLCNQPFAQSISSKDAFGLEATAERIAMGSTVSIPCVVPNSRIWLASRRRFLLGIEGLLLQGCDPSDLCALRPQRWSNHFLMNLSGNAFCAVQFAAFFVASLSTRAD